QGDEKPHLPSPSIWPVGFAVGIACMLAGIVVSTPAVIVRAVISLFFGALWAGDAMKPPRAPEPTPADQRAAAAMAGAEPEEVNRFPRNQFLELTTLGIAGVI